MEIGYHLAWDLFCAAETHKDKPRFYVSGQNGYESISWQEYADKVKNIAGYFVSHGLNPNDKVAILGNNSFSWCVSHLGVQTVRGTIVPIYPASQPNLLEYFFEHSDAKFLICDQSFLNKISQIKLAGISKIIVMNGGDLSSFTNLPVISFQDAIEEGTKHLDKVDEVMKTASDLDIASIIYTSGTTGLPKGVMLSHRNAQSSAADWITLNSPSIPEYAVDLHWLPLSHTFGSGSIMLGNRLGWQTYFADHKEVIEKLKEVKPHLFLSVPAYWEKIYNLMNSHEGGTTRENFDKVTGGRLTFGLSGGAGLKKEIKEGFFSIGFLIIEGYGLTECSPTLTMNRKDKFNFDSVGVPYPSVQLKLADDGEILAKGPNIFAGYYKDEASTKNSFDEDGWFKTGDVGMWTEDGFLRIIDRKKEILVTSGGKNIPPQNIERLFQDDHFIQHLVVYGDGKKFLSALVTLNEEAVRKKLEDNSTDWQVLQDSEAVKNLVDERLAIANAQLASYETVKKVYIHKSPLTVEENLLTSSFKIRRKAIYEKFKNELESLY